MIIRLSEFRGNHAARLDAAFTRLDLLVSIAAVGLLLALSLPLLGSSARSQRVVCVNNLRQCGIAFRSYAMSNQEKFPWQVNTNANIVTNFLMAQKELGTPQITVCPSDTKAVASSFTNGFGNANLSYFLNRRAQMTEAANLLSGDRNIPAGAYSLRWDESRNHGDEGNLTTVDGSVRQLSSHDLMDVSDRARVTGYAMDFIVP